MSNICKPWQCPECQTHSFNTLAVYVRQPGKGFVRIGWLYRCGHFQITAPEYEKR